MRFLGLPNPGVYIISVIGRLGVQRGSANHGACSVGQAGNELLSRTYPLPLDLLDSYEECLDLIVIGQQLLHGKQLDAILATDTPHIRAPAAVSVPADHDLLIRPEVTRLGCSLLQHNEMLVICHAQSRSMDHQSLAWLQVT